MKPNIDYGQQIKALLIEKHLEQKELAQELGTSYINVNKTLNGHRMTTKKGYRLFDRVAQVIHPEAITDLKTARKQLVAVADAAREA